MIYLFYFLMSIVHVFSIEMPVLKPFDPNTMPECPPQYEKCYDIDETIHLVKNISFEKREKFEQLMQVYENTQMMLGRLIPSLNFANLVGVGVLDPKSILRFVGFLFPGNWFRWNENRHLYKAQQWSYYNVVASEVRAGEVIYYTANMFNEITYIYDYYSQYLQQVLNYLYKDKNPDQHNSDIHFLKVLSSEFAQKKLEARNSLISLITSYFNELGISHKINWEKRFIKTIVFRNHTDFNKVDINEHLPKVYNRSPLLWANKELYIAAQNSKKAQFFEWLDPYSLRDSSLGYGLYHSLQIVKHKKHQIMVLEDRIFSRLRFQTELAVESYNNLLDYYQENEFGIGEVMTLVDLIRDTIVQQHEYNVPKLYLAVSKAMAFDLAKLFILYSIWNTGSLLRNLMLEGKYYQDIPSMIPGKNVNIYNSHFKSINPDNNKFQ